MKENHYNHNIAGQRVSYHKITQKTLLLPEVKKLKIIADSIFPDSIPYGI